MSLVLGWFSVSTHIFQNKDPDEQLMKAITRTTTYQTHPTTFKFSFEVRTHLYLAGTFFLNSGHVTQLLTAEMNRLRDGFSGQTLSSSGASPAWAVPFPGFALRGHGIFSFWFRQKLLPYLGFYQGETKLHKQGTNGTKQLIFKCFINNNSNIEQYPQLINVTELTIWSLGKCHVSETSQKCSVETRTSCFLSSQNTTSSTQHPQSFRCCCTASAPLRRQEKTNTRGDSRASAVTESPASCRQDGSF